ncbi:MAG: hypothetical protein ACJAZO_001867 [Myxococcota bacterium]|jgi:hypothetical protein
MAELPERNAHAEDVFVDELSNGDDIVALETAITDCLDARRPQLAARLVGLLDERVEIEPGSALHRAQQAATFFLFNKPTPADNSWSALDDAWREVRSKMVLRARKRMRNVANGKNTRIGRVVGKSTRRH